MSASSYHISPSQHIPSWGFVLSYLVLIAVLTGVYFSSVGELGLSIHDAEMFRDHERINRDFSFFFSDDREQLTGRPVAELAKWLLYAAYGTDPSSFHVAVVALHAAASALLAVVVWNMGATSLVAAATGLLFLVNTAHFQSVHHISALDYPLALICSLLAVHFCLLAVHSESRLYKFGCALCFVCGLLTHIATASVLLFCAYVAAFAEGSAMTACRRILSMAILALPTLALSLYLTPDNTTTQRALSILDTGGLLHGATQLFAALLNLLGRLAATAHWLPYAPHTDPFWVHALGAALLMPLIALMVQRNQRLASLAAAWTLLTLIPFLIAASAAASGSRYLYWAAAGFSLLLAEGLHAACRRLGAKSSTAYAIALLSLGLSSYRAQNHAQAITLYESGKHAMNRHDLEEGKRQLQRAIERQSDVIPLGDAYFQVAMLQLSRRADHREVLRQGLERVPDDVYLNVLDAAIRHLNANEQVTYAPSDEKAARADTALGFIYRTLGYRAELDKQYARATRAYIAGLNYTFWRDESRSSLLRAIHHWSRTGRPIGDVERQLLRSCLTHGIPDAQSGDYARLGLDLGEWGFSGLSALAYGRALEIDAGNVIARNNLGWALYQQRNYSAAIDQFRRVLERGPNSAAAFNLGITYLASGDIQHGEALYAEAVKRYGTAEARRIGAVEDLRQLIGRGGHPVVEKVLVTYWPDVK